MTLQMHACQLPPAVAQVGWSVCSLHCSLGAGATTRSTKPDNKHTISVMQTAGPGWVAERDAQKSVERKKLKQAAAAAAVAAACWQNGSCKAAP